MEGQSRKNKRCLLLLVALCMAGLAHAVGRQVSEDTCPNYAGRTLQLEEGFSEELRILMVGKTGVGKSATGNTILSKQAFKSDLSSSSVTSQCKKDYKIVNGRKVSVIDSPGLFDTQLTAEEVVNRIRMCIPFSAPGPHVFLVVIKLDRFTEEDEKTVQILKKIFGKESSTYTMALFTHGDKLKGKSIHQFIRENNDLLNVIKKCAGRYHVFNNEDQNPEQVVQLLDQIDKMVTVNGGEHYTTEMLQEVERVIEEKKQRILKENEEQRLKEMEELRKKLKGEALEKALKKLKEKHDREAREQAERDPTFFERIRNYIYWIIDGVNEILSYIKCNLGLNC